MEQRGMGPCFRRDDVGVRFQIQLSNSDADTRPHSRGARSARALRQVSTLVKRRGRREDRVRAAPAVSCATCTKQNAHEHTGSAETLRPSPRNGFTAYFALSPVTGLFATVIPEKRLLLTNLTPAPGRQVHTTSPYVLASLVRISFAPTPSRPPLPVPRLRRWPTPLWWDRMRES